MTTRSTTLVLGALALTLSACAANGPRGPSDTVIERALRGAPGEAQPSTIVSTEIAYARAAREKGFVDAARDFAASGALIHGRNGVVPFDAVAPALERANIQIQWGPRVVVKSCDGSLALSQGRFVDGEGMVGNYVTVWARQDDNSYRWTYDNAGLDDPQPSPRMQAEEGDIIVTAMNMVRGLVATCPRNGESVPPPPPIPAGESGDSAVQVSRDGTLRWRWEHRDGDNGDSVKYVTADYWFEGEWVTAIEESLASADEG